MTSSLRIVAAAMFGMALPMACTNLEAPTAATESQLVVHAVMDMSVARQLILVFRARTGARSAITGDFSHDEPVTGAQITVTSPDGTIVLSSDAANPDSTASYAPGVYAVWPANVGVTLAPGATYTLRLRTPAGEEVSGTTTVPRPIADDITETGSDDFQRLRDTLRMTWPRVPGARSYEVLVRANSSGEYRTFTDTAVALPGTTLTITGDMVFLPHDFADIVVSAVDANYYDYYRAQSDPFAGAAPSHLIGAVGVFGVTVPIIRRRIRVE